MFGTSTFIALGIMVAAGVILPVGLAIWWIRTKHEKITTMLVGAAAFLVFALILESLVHNIVLRAFPVIFNTTALYVIYGALMAGLFEETARYIAFRTVLKKRRNRETSISYGIGHGGFEALIFLAYGGFQYITYAVLINGNQLQPLIDEAAAAGVDTSAIEALPSQIAAITLPVAGVSILERIFAVTLHIGLSILVFYAVKKSGPALYALAIALHALFDVPAALYQKGVLGQGVVEVILGVFAVILFIAVFTLLYKKDAGAAPKAEPEAVSEA